MHALIVLAHPEEHSFSAAMARTAAEALRNAGWTVDLDDLAREGFHAEASRDDLAVVPSDELVQLMERPAVFGDRQQKRARHRRSCTCTKQ